MAKVSLARPTDAVALDKDLVLDEKVSSLQELSTNSNQETSQAQIDPFTKSSMLTQQSVQRSRRKDASIDSIIDSRTKQFLAIFSQRTQQITNYTKISFKQAFDNFILTIKQLASGVADGVNSTQQNIMGTVTPMLATIPFAASDYLKDLPSIKDTGEAATGADIFKSAEQASGPVQQATPIKSREDFFRKMYPEAVRASNELGGKIPPEAILAQWTMETGGGKSVGGSNNYGGIKDLSDKSLPLVETTERYSPAELKAAQAAGEEFLGYMSKEEVDRHQGPGAYEKAVQEGRPYMKVKSRFKKFKDEKDFTNNFIRILKNPRYKNTRESSNAEELARNLYREGYYTGDPNSYAKGVGSISKEITQTMQKPPEVVAQQQVEKDKQAEQPAALKEQAAEVRPPDATPVPPENSPKPETSKTAQREQEVPLSLKDDSPTTDQEKNLSSALESKNWIEVLPTDIQDQGKTVTTATEQVGLGSLQRTTSPKAKRQIVVVNNTNNTQPQTQQQPFVVNKVDYKDLSDYRERLVSLA